MVTIKMEFGRKEKVVILVDIYIPSVDESFDFMLDENTGTEKIILEISEMMSRKIQGKSLGDISEFMLYHVNQQKMIDKQKTLKMAGVRDGSRLMLV